MLLMLLLDSRFAKCFSLDARSKQIVTENICVKLWKIRSHFLLLGGGIYLSIYQSVNTI